MSDPTVNQTPAVSISLDGIPGAQTEPSAQATSPPAAEPALSQYAQEWLGQVAETDRDVVSKYLSSWDAGTQRRVADFQRQYAPLQEFVQQGYDVEDLQLGLQVMDMLSQDTNKGIEMLMQAVGYQPPGQQAPPDPQQQGQPSAQVQLPPELTQQLQQQTQFMEQFALQQQQAQQAAADAQADQELDNYLDWLKKEKGDFDEGYVLSQMSQGVPGDQAVDQFNQIIQARLAAQQPGPGNGALPPVPVLNGGAAATQQVPPAQMDDQTRRNLVASMLNHANAQPG